MSGLSRFFSSVYGKTIPGLAFFSLALVSVKEPRSYPLMMEQIVRGGPEPSGSEDEVEPSDPCAEKHPLLRDANAEVRREVGTETRGKLNSPGP